MFRTFLSKIPKPPQEVQSSAVVNEDDGIIDPLNGAKVFVDPFEDAENLETTEISPNEAWLAGTETYNMMIQAEDLNNLMTTSLPEFANESLQALVTVTKERLPLISPLAGSLFYILHSYHTIKCNQEDFEDIIDRVVHIADRLLRFRDDIEFITTVLKLTTSKFVLETSLTTATLAAVNAAGGGNAQVPATARSTTAGAAGIAKAPSATEQSPVITDEQSIVFLQTLQALCKVIFETNHLMISVEKRQEAKNASANGSAAKTSSPGGGGGNGGFVGNLKKIIFNSKDKEKIQHAIATLKEHLSNVERTITSTYIYAQQYHETMLAMTNTPRGLLGSKSGDFGLGLIPFSTSVPGTAGIKPKTSNNHESELYQLKSILSPIAFEEMLNYHFQFYAKDSRTWLIDEVMEWFTSSSNHHNGNMNNILSNTSTPIRSKRKVSLPQRLAQQKQHLQQQQLQQTGIRSPPSGGTSSPNTSAATSGIQTPQKQSQSSSAVTPTTPSSSSVSATMTTTMLSQKKSVFWLQADIGMGKSVFSAALAKHIHRDRLLGIIFFQFNDPRCSDPILILKSLLFQLVAKFPEICSKMLEIIESYKHHVETVTVVYEKYFIAALSLLQSAEIISEEEPMLIILDGIDEVSPDFDNNSTTDSGTDNSNSSSGNGESTTGTAEVKSSVEGETLQQQQPSSGENPRKRFLNMLANKLIRQQFECVKLFVTSRCTPELEKILLPYAHVITENDPRHGQDVRRYLHQSLQEVYEESFPEMISQGQGWESMTDLLYNKSEGKFLYTSLVHDELVRFAENCNTPATPEYNLSYFHYCLDNLPNGLNDCYMTIFNQLGEMINDTEMFRNFIMLLITAYEPIAVEVMKFMLNLSSSSGGRQSGYGMDGGYGGGGGFNGYGDGSSSGFRNPPSIVNGQINYGVGMKMSMSQSSDGYGGIYGTKNGPKKGSKRSSRLSFGGGGGGGGGMHNHHHQSDKKSVNRSRSRSTDMNPGEKNKFAVDQLIPELGIPSGEEDALLRSASMPPDDTSHIANYGGYGDVNGGYDIEDENRIEQEFENFLQTLQKIFPIHCLESSITGDIERKIYPFHKSLVDWLLDEEKSKQWYVHRTKGHEMIIRQSLKYFQITITNPIIGGKGVDDSGGSNNGGGVPTILRGEQLRNIDSLKNIQMFYYYDVYNNYDDIDNEKKNDLIALYCFNHLTKHLDAYHALSNQHWTLLTYFLFTSLSWLQWSLETLSVDVVVENINRTLCFISSLTSGGSSGGGSSTSLSTSSSGKHRLDRLASDYNLIVWLLDFLSPASRHPWFQGWMNELPTQIVARLKDYRHSNRLNTLYNDATCYLNIYGGWEIISAPLTTPNSILQRAVKIENAIIQAINFDPMYCAAIVCSLRSEDPYRFIAIINTNTGEIVKKLEGHVLGVTSLHYLGDKELISGSSDDTLRVWDIDSGDCKAVLYNAGSKVVMIHSNCQFKQDGWGFEAANFRMITYAKNDTKIKIWTNECNRVHPSMVQLPTHLQPSAGAVAHLPSHLKAALGNTGSPRVTFATGTVGGTASPRTGAVTHGSAMGGTGPFSSKAAAQAFQQALGPQCHCLEVPNLVRGMSFISIQHFVYGTKNADLYLVDAFTNKVIKAIASIGKAMTGICILDRESFVISHEGGDMSIWNSHPTRFNKIKTIKCNNYNMRNLTYLGNQRMAFTFLQDLESSDDESNESPEVGKVFIWNLETGKRETTLGGSFLPQVLSSCSSSSSTRMFHEEKLISYGMDGWIKTYNIEAVPAGGNVGGTSSNSGNAGGQVLSTASAGSSDRPRRVPSNSSIHLAMKNALYNNTLVSIDRERIVTTTSDGSLVICNIQTGSKDFVVDVVTGSKCALIPFKSSSSSFVQSSSVPSTSSDVEDRVYIVCQHEEIMLFNVRTKEVERRFDGCYGNVEVMNDQYMLAIESMPKDIINNAKKPIMKQSKWLLSQQTKPSFSICQLETEECLRQCGFPYETISSALYLPNTSGASSPMDQQKRFDYMGNNEDDAGIDEEARLRQMRKSGSRGKLLTGMSSVIKLWNLEEPEEESTPIDADNEDGVEEEKGDLQVKKDKNDVADTKEFDKGDEQVATNHHAKKEADKGKTQTSPKKKQVRIAKDKDHWGYNSSDEEELEKEREREREKERERQRYIAMREHLNKVEAEKEREKEKLRREAMCERIFEGHSDEVTQLCKIKEDIFASVSKDMTIRIWCLLTGECLGILEIEDFNEHAKLCFVKLEEDLPPHEEDEDDYYYNEKDRYTNVTGEDTNDEDGGGGCGGVKFVDDGEVEKESNEPKIQEEVISEQKTGEKEEKDRAASSTLEKPRTNSQDAGKADVVEGNILSTPQLSKSVESLAIEDSATAAATTSSLTSSLSMPLLASRSVSNAPLLPPSKSSKAKSATEEVVSPVTTGEDGSLDSIKEAEEPLLVPIIQPEEVVEEEKVTSNREKDDSLSSILAAQREQRNQEERRRKRRGPGRLYYRYDNEMLRIWDFKTLNPIADLKLPGILVAMETDSPRLDGKFFFHEDHSPNNLIFNKENYYVFSSWKHLVFAKKIEPNYDLWY